MRRQFNEKAALRYIAKYELKKLRSIMIEPDIEAISYIPNRVGDPTAILFYKHSVSLDKYFTAHKDFLYMDY